MGSINELNVFPTNNDETLQNEQQIDNIIEFPSIIKLKKIAKKAIEIEDDDENVILGYN